MKKNLLVFLFFAASINCFSQSNEDLNQQQSSASDDSNLRTTQKLFEKAKRKAEKEENYLLEDYITSLYKLAVLYKNMNQTEKAEPFYLELIPLARKTSNLIIYLNSLTDLAYLYLNWGDYLKAEPLLKLTLKFISKNQTANRNVQYSKALRNLANLYLEMGNYAKAEPLYLKALEINNILLYNYGPDYPRSLIDLANFYLKIGNYAKAEPLYIEAFELLKKMSWEEHSEYYNSLDNLADLYLAVGNYVKAESIYFEAYEIRKKILGEQHSGFANSLIKLGNMYMIKGDYAKAEPLLLQALVIKRRLLGEKDRYYAAPLESLADLYFNKGDFEKAKPLYVQVIEIKRKTYGKNHPEYSSTLYKLANLFERIKEYGRTDSLLKLSIVINERNWKSNFSFLSSSESEKFIIQNESNIEYPMSFLYRNPNADLSNNLLDLSIFLKNVLLSTNNILRQTTTSSKDSLISIKWEYYKALRFQIDNQYQLPITLQMNLNKMEQRVDDLEKELIRNQPIFRQTIINNNIKWKDIQNRLLQNEAVIDFVSFRYYEKRRTDTIIYAAFVIKSGSGRPRFVSLFREDELLELLGKENNTASINRLYRPRKKVPNLENTNKKELYELIWKPIDSLLTGIQKIYLSPSGILHKVAFAAISLPEGGEMIDRYQLEIISTIRTLAQQNNFDTTINTFALFGGIDYDNMPFVKVKSIRINSTNGLSSSIELRNMKNGKWPYLPGTQNEISGIEKIIKVLNIPVFSFSKQDASEENFKQFSRTGKNFPPSIIHFATHGFSFPKTMVAMQNELLVDDKRTIFQQTEDPLTRSGLILAGGNEAWVKGKPFPNREDEILTAREVSNLDLRGCVLATLSACETGLGDIKGNEGVFGLQRGFKMAGVNYLMVSLWKVPDIETAEFMKIFYSYWLIKKMSIKQAFRQTQINLSKKYNPYNWAAFVLIE